MLTVVLPPDEALLTPVPRDGTAKLWEVPPIPSARGQP